MPHFHEIFRVFTQNLLIFFFLAGRRSSTPASADDIHQGSAPQTPQERRRFGFGKYFERSNKTDKTNTASSNDINADVSTPKSGT